jgi:SAM-dependent methyltransferase
MKPILLNTANFPTDFDFRNNQFPPLDALTYWHFLKKAKRVIEVGCGYSTYLAMKSNIEVTAIDPHPRVYFSEIAYTETEVQKVDISIFKNLRENDILFIDSSHIYKEGSDVEFLIKKVLPTLNKGVLIHFHDFFGVDGYPEEWKTVPEMKDWNENEYVLPLLEKYEVLAINHYISKEHNESLKLAFPFVPKDITTNLGAVRGASLWLKSN